MEQGSSSGFSGDFPATNLTGVIQGFLWRHFFRRIAGFS